MLHVARHVHKTAQINNLSQILSDQSDLTTFYNASICLVTVWYLCSVLILWCRSTIARLTLTQLPCWLWCHFQSSSYTSRPTWTGSLAWSHSGKGVRTSTVTGLPDLVEHVCLRSRSVCDSIGLRAVICSTARRHVSSLNVINLSSTHVLVTFAFYSVFKWTIFRLVFTPYTCRFDVETMWHALCAQRPVIGWMWLWCEVWLICLMMW